MSNVAAAFTMSRPCRSCGSLDGHIETRGLQDCVFCAGCGAFVYNAPKTETGRKVRSLQTTHEAITARQRARIIVRATARCELCGSTENLTVGHLLSVEDGHRSGIADVVLNSDENLAAMCAECNIGLGAQTVPLRLYVAILRRRTEGS